MCRFPAIRLRLVQQPRRRHCACSTPIISKTSRLCGAGASFPFASSFVRDAAYSAAAQERTLAGFDFWLRQIPNGPTFQVVSTSQQSDLKVTFYRFDSNATDTLGVTRVFSSTDPAFAGTIARAEMDLGITGNNTLDIATAAHEYGHALGVLGHSENPDDLMYFPGQ